MTRTAAAALLILVLTAAAAPAGAGVMSAGDYARVMAGLEDTRTAMTEARAALAAGPGDPAAARARADDLARRLDASRAAMRDAVKHDRTAIPMARLTPERRRARCVVMEAGLIDEPLRDLWTRWSLRARGAPDPDTWDVLSESTQGFGRRPGCG